MLLQLTQRVFALLSLLLLGLGAWLVWSWWDTRQALEAFPLPGTELEPWPLWTGAALLALSAFGRPLMLALLARKGDDAERLRRPEGERLETPAGADLHLEGDGPADAPVLVFVHGWGLDAGVWWDARRNLAGRFAVIAYDLAGLGRSTPPRDGRYSLERFADDLAAIVSRADRRQVILVGHSIGGMIIQTFCRRHPEMLRRRVVGVVLENTTHTDPTATTILGKGLQALKPLLAVLMRIDIPLSPVMKLLNWQSYLSGQTHLAMRLGGFGTRPTRAQLEQVALAVTRNSPAIQAKGNLAMMRWSATDDLPDIDIPALVFIGGRDIVTVPQAGETIARGLPQSTLQRVERAGHLGPIELADIYAAAIARFADRVFAGGASSDRARPPAYVPRPIDEDGWSDDSDAAGLRH